MNQNVSKVEENSSSEGSRSLNSQEQAQFVAKVHSETYYYVRCSDCENHSDDYFNPQQAAELASNEGWRLVGSRLVCPKCASHYSEPLT